VLEILPGQSKCYHHQILCSEIKEGIFAEVEQLKASLALDLADV
jgi:hypothetical protein